MQNLQLSKDKEASTVASKTLGIHLWYLSEEKVSLAFMDEGVTINMKRKMVSALQKLGSLTHQKNIYSRRKGKHL